MNRQPFVNYSKRKNNVIETILTLLKDSDKDEVIADLILLCASHGLLSRDELVDIIEVIRAEGYKML
jgi:hypothetical protein